MNRKTQAHQWQRPALRRWIRQWDQQAGWYEALVWNDEIVIYDATQAEESEEIERQEYEAERRLP